jgi:type IV pilus assembly protein PilM
MLEVLNKNIFSYNHTPIGLDLSDLSVKVVQLEQIGKYQKVRSFGTKAIPSGMINDGEIVDIDNVSKIIKEMLNTVQGSKINSKKVFCSLPEVKAFLRIIEMPKMKEDEIKEAIKWKMEENIPLGIDQVYFDWQILDNNFSGKRGQVSVLVVAVARTTVDSFISLLEGIGMEVVGMEIESIAQVRSLLLDGDTKKETTLVVDIGDRRTSLLFAVNGTICFTSGMSVSSQVLTDAIVKHFNFTQEKAEELKIQKGIGSFIRNDALFQAVSPVLENLMSQIETSTHFFISGLGYAEKVDRLILCGGGSNTKGLSVFLTKRLGMNVERGNPWMNVKLGKSIPPIPNERAIQYSTAIGLALQGIDYNYEDLS